MADRPVFCVDYKNYFRTEYYNFEYHPGFSCSQKEKNIVALHNSFLAKHPNLRILEISTKSPDAIGRELSAFNLKCTVGNKLFPLECVFQSSKVFENGGPFLELLSLSPSDAKRSPLLQENGKLTGFVLNGISFSLTPKTFFYDWLYINALQENETLAIELIRFDAFTDIEFNPNKSINCQARSAAIFVSLSKTGFMEKALSSPEQFKQIVYGDEPVSVNEQLSLF